MPVKSLLSNTARTLSGQQRAELAIETIKHNRPITELSAQHNVSRNFLYDQKGELQPPEGGGFNLRLESRLSC